MGYSLGRKYTQRARLNYLDFYKGICILFIIITHYEWTNQQRLNALFPFWIDMAVPVFMTVTGYVSAMSFEVHEHSLKSVYLPTEIMRKWLRFVVPFLPVYALQIALRIVILKENISAFGLLKSFIKGGYGPGSYYFPVMLQTVLIVPILWAVIKKFRVIGLIGCFAVNFLFEIVKTLSGMNPGAYRLCALRYLFILAFGVYLFYRKPEKKNPWCSLLGALGLFISFCLITQRQSR